MAYRTRIKYTPEQKEEIWNRWKKGESVTSIGRLFIGPPHQSLTCWRQQVAFVPQYESVQR